MNKAAYPLSKDSIINFLRKNMPILHEKFGVDRVALFGSYARGDFTPDSDIDLLVDISDKSFRNWVEVQEFLQDSLGKKVDLVDQEGLRRFIRRMIEPDLVYA